MATRGSSREPRPIGPSDAARRLGVSTRTVQRWLKAGLLPSIQIGDRLKVHPSAFDDRVAGSNAEPLAAQPSAAVPEAAVAPWVAGAPIHRLLIANRGELVVRIARTCRAIGVTPIALVAEDQRSAWWAQQVDERVDLSGTYLDADAILAAARRANADAIHPGYGFLAENASFADAVSAAGIRWVGPSGAAMRALGDKAAGRRLAAAVGVPVVPGYDGDDQRDETLHASAAAIGYPVLVKPSAGGGGKGMHVALDHEQLMEALPRARREANAAFGNDRLILERYVPHPRHVEVQILADAFGNAVHLGERDCSLQRRHQKVVEEAPSPAVNAALRQRLGDAALRLVRAAGYVGAGTAEFLLDPDGGFFFLEVNARLQVEHPVTEAVTGRDLVADQLRIAAGEPLALAQADVSWSGHAIEVRIYAEDPWNDFLPSIGSVHGTRWPAGAGVRVDAGVGQGDVVGTRYDPLLAKIVSHANDRADALARLHAAVESASVLGVTTNRGFLRQLLDDPDVRTGNTTTDLIERTWHPGGEPSPDPAWPVAAAALATLTGQPAGRPTSGFRLNARPALRVAIGLEERSVAVHPGAAGRLPWVVQPGASAPAVFIDVDGLAVHAELAAPPTVDSAVAHAHGSAPGKVGVTAPMPGTVLQVRVSDGDLVEAGQVLVVLEAMKMENTVTAPSAGTVERVVVQAGQQVGRGDVLVEMD